MSRLPVFDIIIVNWNSGSQLASCVDSIAASRMERFRLGRVVIVDNASADGSSDVAAPKLPLVLIRNRNNLGFGAACNQGARGSSADYLLFMNPDVEVRPDTLALCADFWNSPESRGVGVLGPRLVDGAGCTQRSCARFPSPAAMAARSMGLDRVVPSIFPPHFMADWDHDASRRVDQVMGAFFFVRAATFHQLRGFDERFFLYWEDVDFAYRARQAGWSCYYLSQAEAFHKGGGTTDHIRPRRLSYSLRSRLQFARKHFSGPGLALVVASTLTIEPLARASKSLIQRDLVGIADVVRAYGLLLSESRRRREARME